MDLNLYRAYPKAKVSTASGATGSPDNEVSSIFEQFRAFIGNFIALVPTEVVLLYPILLSLSQYSDTPKTSITISSMIALGITLLVRTALLPENKKPSAYSIILSTLVCVLWIYAVGGYFVIEMPGKYRFNLLLATIGCVAAGAILLPKKDPKT